VAPIKVFTTGGTIAMREGGKIGPTSNAINDGDVEFIELVKKDSSDILFSDWEELADKISSNRSSDIIVTHGTDTIEEGAFYIAEVLVNRPVAFVGAMRQSDSPDYDGLVNFQVAKNSIKNGLPGVAVCIGGQAFSAASAEKIDSFKINSFIGEPPSASGNWIGKKTKVDPSLVRVVWIGADTRPEELQRQIDGAPGVILLAPGAGTVPKRLRKTITQIASGSEVVLKTRCFSGPAEDPSYTGYWDEIKGAGVKIENFLSPAKTRVRLLLSLGLGIKYRPWENRPPTF